MAYPGQHPQSVIVIAWALGAEVQCRDINDERGKWWDCSFQPLFHRGKQNVEYRVKPNQDTSDDSDDFCGLPIISFAGET